MEAGNCRPAWEIAFNAYYADTGFMSYPGYGTYGFGGWGAAVAEESYPEIALCQTMEMVRDGEAQIRAENIDVPHYPDSGHLWPRSEEPTELFEHPIEKRDLGLNALFSLLEKEYPQAYLAVMELDREEASLKLRLHYRYYVLRRLHMLGMALPWHTRLFEETSRQLSPAWREKLDSWAGDKAWDGEEVQRIDDWLGR